MNDIGALIRGERLARHWSQEGLCKGICAVSYLSKIEQGKVEPSDEIRRLLFERLGLPTEEDSPALREAAALLEQLTERLFLGDTPGMYALEERFEAARPLLSRSRYAAQAALLHEALQPVGKPLPAALEIGLDERLLAYQRILQNRYDEALRLYPHAFTYCSAGNAAYQRGDYRTAIALLRHAHTLAAEDDAVHLMLQSRAFLGNCYCNELRLPQMEREYAAALRLSELLHDTNLADTIRYNTAAGQLEGGQYEAACAYFSALENPGRMALHKLAICCEKLGRPDEARAALARARAAECDYPPEPLSQQICDIVAFRLDHPDYLQREEYGVLLLGCFRTMRRELPAGYVSFHLPWVLEWYTANRRYKEAYELTREFSEKY